MPTLRSLAAFALALGPLPALAQDPLNVVATVGMIGDVVGEVGGACVAVDVMMGPGIDPHLYQATANDVQTLNHAALIVYSGYSLEGQLADVLERYGARVPTLAAAEAGIDRGQLIATDDSYGVDPHVWMDVSLWAETVPAVAQALAEARPDCADAIATNAADYETQLEALHDWVGAAVATIPEQQRILVTAHDAFAYYGRAYGIEVAGIQGISTQAEAAIADIRQTAQLIARRGVPAIFVESTINPRTVEAVIAAARDAGQDIEVGGELFSDAMGDDNTAEGTYIGMIHANTITIVTALGGTPPALPDELGDWSEKWAMAAE
ncbi:metal ABC transporter solute-binding protein, Zn/Mn family [Pelagibacterium lacus]|uniref:Manganese transporter n=1 Tax=Pelagibacterium lacus TaxID=2282655 RepID=A0A369W5K4_9HYPH|nr:zinc ABC transporter substrate-binding protein [Pelagibacterium lacus]RDE09135.1 manganese transporter [Pelagibacterium lacus]